MLFLRRSLPSVDGTEEPSLDVARVLRIIRVQANLVVLLIVTLAGVLIWFTRIKNTVDIHAMSKDFEPPVKVNITTKLFSGDKNITATGISPTPFVTFYGFVQDYALLRDALPAFSVTLRGVSADIRPENGEFVDKILLKPGANEIDLLIWWDGLSRYRQRYSVTYVPPEAVSSTPPITQCTDYEITCQPPGGTGR